MPNCTDLCALCARTLGDHRTTYEHSRCMDDIAETTDGQFMHWWCYDDYVFSPNGYNERQSRVCKHGWLGLGGPCKHCEDILSKDG